jgi:NADH-quinone oxidoreductase subunit N
MYFSPPGPDAQGNEPYVVVAGPLTVIVIGLSVLVTLVLGLAPNWFLDLLSIQLPFLG